MVCANCGKRGVIGNTLFGRPNGMIPKTRIRRIDYLCADCSKKVPLDKQLKGRHE